MFSLFSKNEVFPFLNDRLAILKRKVNEKHDTKEGSDYFNEKEKAFLKVYSFLIVFGTAFLLFRNKIFLSQIARKVFWCEKSIKTTCLKK